MSDIPFGEIHLECPHCMITDQFALPDDATEGSEIVCNACRKAICTVGEFNAEVIRKGRSPLPGAAKALGEGVKAR